MKIKTKIELKDYIKLMYILTYRKWTMKFILAMGLFSFIFSISYIFGIIESTEIPILPIVFSFVVIFLLPITVYFSSKKNYNTHTRLQEEVTYEISTEDIKISGDSFNTEMTWEKTYKVLELKSWLLIYQNKMIANIIPKEYIGDHLSELREIIKSTNIKSKLKNN